MTSRNLPDITDHAFMRMLREQCATTKPMSRIASELGVDVDDLCAWIMEYREPRRSKPYISKDGPPMAPSRGDDPHANARRFAAWRRQHDGAAMTKAMLAEDVNA